MNLLPRILFDGLLERLSGAVGVPSSMGEVMELKNVFLYVFFLCFNIFLLDGAT